MAIDLQGLEVLSESERWHIARNAAVLGVVLSGVVDDATSDGWRAVVAQSFAEQPLPQFLVVDTSAMESSSALATRMRSAEALKRVAARLSRVVLITGVRSTLAVKAVARVGGTDNVHIVDADEGALLWPKLKAGVDPFGAP